MYTKKTLLITGGTGTFGNEVLRRFLDTDIEQIRIFSRDEKKQEDMRLLYNNAKIKYYVGDIRFIDSIAAAVRDVDLVFHAAALKQVPSCEFYPLEAFRTNTIGTENVMNASISAAVERLIVLSTDKAVYPINAMGLSKAMMEKLMVAKTRVIGDNSTVLCGTRYGNVMGSRGSVIPHFINQIKAGRPLTITDPEMTRFMMSVEEALDLVLYAFEAARPGDIFVRKSPAVTLDILVKALLEIFQADNPIQIMGTRHGEKLYETLLTREEMADAEDLGDYYRIPADNRDLNYNLYFTEGRERISKERDYNSHNTHRLDLGEMIDLLLELDLVRDRMER